MASVQGRALLERDPFLASENIVIEYDPSPAAPHLMISGSPLNSNLRELLQPHFNHHFDISPSISYLSGESIRRVVGLDLANTGTSAADSSAVALSHLKAELQALNV